MPSLVTMIEVPVSATRKLAPVIPTSADWNFWRRIARASASSLLGLREVAVGREMAMDAAKVLDHVVLGHMDRGRDDVRGRFAADLDDIFAKVGLDRLHAGRFEGLVEADLLGDHRFALGDALCAQGLA